VSVVSGVQYAYVSGSELFVAPGRESLSTVVSVDRDELIYGTYIPGTADDVALGITGIQLDSVGTVNDALITNVIEQSTLLTLSSSTPASYFENTHFRCPTQVAASLGDVTFTNCRFSGMNPEILFAMFNAGTAISIPTAGGITNWTGNHITFIDCEFDVSWWIRNGLSTYWSWQHSAALYGGHFTLQRCLVRGFTDGFNFTGAPGNSLLDQYILIEGCRLGPNFYAQNIPAAYSPQSGAYTHSDGFQFNTGGNVEIRYSYIGGPRLSSAAPNFPGSLAMRDAGNAGLMIQQEPDSRYTEERKRVDGIYVHHNWIAGGSATVNLNYAQNNTLPSPALAPVGWVGNRVQENRIMQRISGFNDSGYQIRYRTEMETDVAGNVTWNPFGPIDGTGTPVTVHEVSNAGSGDVTVATWPSPAI
jgi:hypothetical protein